jgi:hypothetical protein
MQYKSLSSFTVFHLFSRWIFTIGYQNFHRMRTTFTSSTAKVGNIDAANREFGIPRRPFTENQIIMTNAMPMIINSLFTYFDHAAVAAEGREFIESARAAITNAQTELGYAETAFGFADVESATPNLKLAEIARWHYEESIHGFAQGVKTLERARKLKLPAKYRKYIDSKIEKCLGEMAHSNKQKLALSSLLRNAKRND